MGNARGHVLYVYPDYCSSILSSKKVGAVASSAVQVPSAPETREAERAAERVRAHHVHACATIPVPHVRSAVSGVRFTWRDS